MRDVDEALIRSRPQIDGLLPIHILPNNEHANASLDELANNQLGTAMQLCLDPPVTVIGHCFKLPGGKLLGRQTTLQVSPTLAIALIDSLENTSVNQQRHKARPV